MTSAVQTGAQFVMEFLAEHTAPKVFGLPGSSSVSIFNEFPHSSLEFVPALQENAAVAMADGYARVAGPTAVLLYMLPGVATALSNLYNAHRDDTPLLLIVSQYDSRARRGQAAVGEADITEVVGPFSRFAREVTDASQLAPTLRDAYRACVGPASGPAVVVVPEDVLLAPAVHTQTVRTGQQAVRASHDFSTVAARLASAHRPLIIVGGQLRRRAGSMSIAALADELDIPIMYEPFWNDRLGVDPSDRCLIGQVTPNSSLVKDADVVIAIGCRLFNDVHPKKDPWFAANAFVVHINENATVLGSSMGADLTVQTDVGFAAEDLYHTVLRGGRDSVAAELRAARLRDAKQRRNVPREGPYSVAGRALAGSLDSGYLVDESVSGNSALMELLSSTGGARYVSTSGGSLGWGIGAACGIALATGEPVTCVLGDGAFFFGLQSLLPAVQHQLPITFVVLDNGGFGSTRWFARRAPGAPSDVKNFIGSDFDSTLRSVVNVAAGFGLATSDVRDSELGAYLSERRSGPALVRCEVRS